MLWSKVAIKNNEFSLLLLIWKGSCDVDRGCAKRKMILDDSHLDPPPIHQNLNAYVYICIRVGQDVAKCIPSC